MRRVKDERKNRGSRENDRLKKEKMRERRGERREEKREGGGGGERNG